MEYICKSTLFVLYFYWLMHEKLEDSILPCGIEGFNVCKGVGYVGEVYISSIISDVTKFP